MRILYGVQGTGNGHISRARAMAPALKKEGIEVDFLFSGRRSEQYFEMETFGNFTHKKGLTFVTEEGRVHQLKTLMRSAPLSFLRDVKQLELDQYDLILTDFEPITAWAGRLRKKTVIGLGHQYAFNFPIPQRYGKPHQQLIMDYFAPAKHRIGLHWYHFDMPILPPIAPVEPAHQGIEDKLILVYLPFETPQKIEQFLAPFEQFHFVVYHPNAPVSSSSASSFSPSAPNLSSNASNITWHTPSKTGFHADLARCNGVISNAGFELSSEALQLGCKLLVYPIVGQIEQESNALALQQIGLGYTMKKLDNIALARWLKEGRGVRVRYPDVAGALARWIKQGDYSRERTEALSAQLWRKTRFPAQPIYTPEELNEAYWPQH